MRHSLALVIVLAICTARIPAAEGMPSGLPYETVVLEDGRTFVGHYDEAQGILWIDGPGSPRLRVLPQQVRSRTPVATKSPTTATPERSVAIPSPVPASLPAQQKAIEDLERQLTDLERRMDETKTDIQRVATHLQEWLKVYDKAERIAQENPTRLGYENNANYNLTKIRSEIQAVRAALKRHETVFERQSTHQALLQSALSQARQALATTTPTTSAVVIVPDITATITVDLEDRLRALELQIASLRQENELLRSQLEAATKGPTPSPPPGTTTEEAVDLLP